MSSRVALQATEVTGNEWTEACLTLSNNDGDQEMWMDPMEMQAVYARLKMYYEQGIWSMGAVHNAS